MARYRLSYFQTTASERAAGSDTSIRALYAGPSGTLYLATSTALGILSPSGAFVWKTAADGLPASRILHLFEDRQGALWIGTEGSVARYANGQFEVLRRSQRRCRNRSLL